MKLDTYITQLLYQYDCVIVPNLGGFVTNYKPASANSIKHSFYPPSKGISFNKNLSHNDGLLANFISRETDVSYEIVIKKLENEVNTILSRLKKYEKVSFEGIGILFIDQENRLQFEPNNTVNYLLDSYGLSTFQKFPINQNENKEKETPVITIQHSTKSKKWIAAAAVVLPLAFLTYWIPAKYDLGSTLNYAQLNPFKTIVPEYKERLSQLQIQTIQNSTQIDSVNRTITFLKNEKPIALFNSTHEIEKDSTRVEIQTQPLNFFIVGGCFAEKRNADKFVKELINSGFSASIIGKRNGLFTVTYGGYSSKNEALENLTKAKNHNLKAWILSV